MNVVFENVGEEDPAGASGMCREGHVWAELGGALRGTLEVGQN